MFVCSGPGFLLSLSFQYSLLSTASVYMIFFIISIRIWIVISDWAGSGGFAWNGFIFKTIYIFLYIHSVHFRYTHSHFLQFYYHYLTVVGFFCFCSCCFCCRRRRCNHMFDGIPSVVFESDRIKSCSSWVGLQSSL